MRDRDDRDLGCSAWGIEQRVDVQRLSLHPTSEGGGGHEVVQRHRKFCAIVCWIERIDIDDPHFFDRRVLDSADHIFHREIIPFGPSVQEDGREEDMFTAGQGISRDVQQCEQARYGARYLIAKGFFILADFL